MVVGILVGTYSTIFIASPIVDLVDRRAASGASRPGAAKAGVASRSGPPGRNVASGSASKRSGKGGRCNDGREGAPVREAAEEPGGNDGDDERRGTSPRLRPGRCPGRPDDETTSSRAWSSRTAPRTSSRWRWLGARVSIVGARRGARRSSSWSRSSGPRRCPNSPTTSGPSSTTRRRRRRRRCRKGSGDASRSRRSRAARRRPTRDARSTSSRRRSRAAAARSRSSPRTSVKPETSRSGSATGSDIGDAPRAWRAASRAAWWAACPAASSAACIGGTGDGPGHGLRPAPAAHQDRRARSTRRKPSSRRSRARWSSRS